MRSVPTFQTTPLNRARNTSEARYPHLWEGMLGAWAPGLGPTGLSLHDISGHGNDGTLENIVLADDWVLDEGRWTLNYDASNNQVTIPNAPILDVDSEPVTVSVWCNLATAGTNRELVSKWNGGGVQWFFLFAHSLSKIGMFCGGSLGDNRALTATTVPLDTWMHIVGVYDGTDTSIYLDGIRGVDASSPLAPASSTADIVIGLRATGANPWSGGIDDVLVYGRALALAEIKLLHQLGRGGWLAKRRRVFAKAPAAPTGITIPVLDHHYSQMRAA